MGAKAPRPGLDVHLHRSPPDVVDGGVDAQHVADLDRTNECHRLDRDRHDPPLSRLRRGDAAGLIHLAQAPSRRKCRRWRWCRSAWRSGAPSVRRAALVPRHRTLCPWSRPLIPSQRTRNPNGPAATAPATTRSTPARSRLAVAASARPAVSAMASTSDACPAADLDQQPAPRATAAPPPPAGSHDRRRARRRRRRARGADRIRAPRAAARRCRRSEYRADSRRSGRTRPSSLSVQSPSANLRPALSKPQASTLRAARSRGGGGDVDADAASRGRIR